MKISESALIKRNSFNEVRLILSFIVYLAHTSVLASANDFTWLLKKFDSEFAITGFFAISGYLVTHSYFRSKSLHLYFLKRVRRIYPAYILVILYCLMIGKLTSNLEFSSFFINQETFNYILANLSFLNFLCPDLPGSLTENKIVALNGSLWTIKVEIMLYVSLPFILLLFRKFSITFIMISILVLGVAWEVFFNEYVDHPLGQTIARQFPAQLPYFAVGSILAMLAVRNLYKVAILVIFIAHYFYFSDFLNESFLTLVNMVLVPCFVIFVAKSRIMAIRIGRIGDLSYGVYLFHFPTIQLFEYFDFYQQNIVLSLIGSTLIILILAYLSWHVVEKRFLNKERV